MARNTSILQNKKRTIGGSVFLAILVMIALGSIVYSFTTASPVGYYFLVAFIVLANIIILVWIVHVARTTSSLSIKMQKQFMTQAPVHIQNPKHPAVSPGEVPTGPGPAVRLSMDKNNFGIVNHHNNHTVEHANSSINVGRNESKEKVEEEELITPKTLHTAKVAPQVLALAGTNTASNDRNHMQRNNESMRVASSCGVSIQAKMVALKHRVQRCDKYVKVLVLFNLIELVSLCLAVIGVPRKKPEYYAATYLLLQMSYIVMLFSMLMVCRIVLEKDKDKEGTSATQYSTRSKKT